MKIVVPMAGEGQRFKDSGFTVPKPFIELFGKTLLKWSIDSVDLKEYEHIFLVREEHHNWFHMLDQLKVDSYKTVAVPKLTEGAACTTLLAEKAMPYDEEIIIVNCDQIIEWDSAQFVKACRGHDGTILSIPCDHPRFSYIKEDKGKVLQVAEKQKIGPLGTVGLYYWRSSNEYFAYVRQMMEKDLRVNNEFYVAPVYNEAIQDGKNVSHFQIDKMHCIGDLPSIIDFVNFRYPYTR
jgi:NDP-sugar pyrophosphorylase family protein